VNAEKILKMLSVMPIAGKNSLRSSVEENLGTLKLVAALYESISTNRVVEL
jgi:hypothetical protein